MPLFHVSSVLNRDSIRTQGLDWSRMGAAPGIAGSLEAEAAGVFLCRGESEAEWFVRMNNTGGPVDVWAVIGIDEHQLIDNGSGLGYFPAVIPPGQIMLAEWPLPNAEPARATRHRTNKRRKKPPRPSK